MTVGFHSPLPPARSGVADYAQSLAGMLRRHGTIEIDSPAADVDLYHLGNNELHREIYRRALRRPGVVVLHDAVLQHFFLSWLDCRQYLDEFSYNYGEWARGLGEDLWRRRAHSGTDERYFRFPMLRRIAEISRAVVVHNPAAKRMVLRHAPQAEVYEIPHLFAPPAPVAAAMCERLRRTLGVGPGESLFTVFGYLRESKRLPVILKAFNQMNRGGAKGVLLVAGEFVSTDLAKAVEPFLARNDVRVAGMTTERGFWLRAAASDACVNLRYPAAGETSGITVRLMGLGKPVIVSEGEEVSGVPAEACLRLSHGIWEVDELAHHMTMLASCAGLARDIGRMAAAHIRMRHSVDVVADLYWKVLCKCRN